MDTKFMIERMGGYTSLAKRFGHTKQAYYFWASDDRIPDVWRRLLKHEFRRLPWGRYEKYVRQKDEERLKKKMAGAKAKS